METVTTPGTDAQSGKTFTPEQVENIVKERLARDREARKDEGSAKIAEAEAKAEEAKTALATATVTIETLKGTSATAEEITAKVKASHASIVASIPADKQKYLPAVSEADQLVYIAKNPELFFPSVTPPNTPPPVNNQSGDGGESKFKGYASESEFAQREPAAYLKAKREGKI